MRDWLIKALGGFTALDVAEAGGARIDGGLSIRGKFIHITNAYVNGPLFVAPEAREILFTNCIFKTPQDAFVLSEQLANAHLPTPTA